MNNRHNEHLGINKLGKNIRKSPLHQPNFGNNNKPQPPQPHVYNISKNDFRNIVQQLTGSPSHNQPPPRPPPINAPKPPSMRLQRIRPPPLNPIARPHQNVQQPQYQPGQGPHFNNGYLRPPPPVQQPLYPPVRPPGEAGWANTAESPISAYMRYLQNSMEPTPRPPFQGQNQYPPHPPHPHSQLPPMQGLLPNPPMSGAFLSPRGNGAPFPPFPSPRGNGAPFPSPRGNGPPFPSPRGNGPALLPSPTSQFLLPSPSAYANLLSPRSPYPFSPGFQFPPPLTPGFFSPLAHQPGLLGAGPQAPPSPGMMFPQSPSGFFPFSSPRWRD